MKIFTFVQFTSVWKTPPLCLFLWSITQLSMGKSHISRIWPNKFFHHQLEKVDVNEFPKHLCFLTDLIHGKKYWLPNVACLWKTDYLQFPSITRIIEHVCFLCFLINSTINAGCFYSFKMVNTPFVSSFKAYPEILISHIHSCYGNSRFSKTPREWRVISRWVLQSRLQCPVHKECGTTILNVVGTIPFVFYTSFIECYCSNLGICTGTKLSLYKFV